MEQEERLAALEREVRLLKEEIQQTLIDIQQTLPDRPTPPARWQKKAWLLALLNILLAVALFTNIYLYLPENSPFTLNPTLATWLRAFWIAMAFMWLILQLYPLALLLEQDDQQWQGIVWRNARSYLRAKPGTIVLLTGVVLLVAIVESIFPAIWLVVAFSLLVVVAAMALQGLLKVFRAQSRR
jgi:hypothetical protein